MEWHDLMLDGYGRVQEYLERVLDGLTQTDLDKELDEPWFKPLPTVGVRLISIMDDAVLHVGQAAYVRGL